MAISNCASIALAGLPRDCQTSQGGIKNAWIIGYDKVQSVTLDEGQNKISSVTLVGEDKFKKYSFKKNTGNFASSLTKDEANGVNFVTTTLNLSFLKMDTQKRVEMSALAVNELAIIVEDANGVCWYLGREESVTATAGAGESGTSRTDGNKYSVTFTDNSSTYPYEIDKSALSTIVDEQ